MARAVGTSVDAPSAWPHRLFMHDIEVFFDGECPLCMREINLVRKFDRKGKIKLTDIADPRFDASAYGFTQKHFMDQMRGRDAAGRWIDGVEVFRRIYTALGLGPLANLSRAPGVRNALDGAYRVFARNRLWLTGRRAAEAHSSAAGEGETCSSGTCPTQAR